MHGARAAQVLRSARQYQSQIAGEALEIFGRLYGIERELAECDAEQRHNRPAASAKLLPHRWQLAASAL
jgi:hypothetical protein